MSSTRFRFQFGIASLLITPFFCASASADRSYALAVPRMESTRPVPVVDGVCGSLEYAGAWRFSPILYRPRAPYDSVRFSAIAGAADLYLCIPRMPLRAGTVEPFVSIVFDVDHDGGRFADEDDIRFTISETGILGVSRGNGSGGFTPVTTVAWEAAVAVIDEFFWTAEIRIPLSEIGGGVPGTVIGFHVRHNWLAFQPDDYVWPPAAGWNVPNTWADLLWLGRTGEVLVDVARITQGLDADLDAGVFCDLIAGKDTIVRAQLYTPGFEPELVRADLRVERVRPSPALVGTDVSISYIPYPRLRSVPRGYFDGSRMLRFSVPGAWVAQPGTYRFTVRVHLVGSPSVLDVRLATKTFHPTNDLNLLLVPVDERPKVANSRAWGADLIGAIPPAMNEVQRMFPVRAGVSPFLFRTPTEAGLRYLFHPRVISCRPGEDPIQDCGARARAYANDVLHTTNAYLNRIDPSGALDRFDFHVALGASTGTLGGQAQLWYDPPSAGAGFDTRIAGPAPAIVAHEVAHCLGEVPASSPHHLPPQNHSRNSSISTVRGFKAVNMLTRLDTGFAASLMFPTVTNAPICFLEGYEWNDLRRALVALPTRVSSESRAAEAAGPLFRLVGLIDVQDRISVIYSKRLDDLPMETTLVDPSAPYRIRFLDPSATELAGYPFHVGYDVLDLDNPVTNTALLLAVPFPAASARAEILKDGNVLWGLDFSSQPPVVSNVVATDSGQGGIDVTWNAVDPDSPQLKYNIYFTRVEDGAITPTLPLLVASGLVDTNFFFPLDMVPATKEGRLIVEATDGVNIGVGVTDPYVVPDRPPVAAIANPSSETVLVALQPVVLRGSAYDFTDGSLSGEALAWRSDKDGALGTGQDLETSLTAGAHRLTLKATAPSGLTAEAFVDVAVLADSDGDGLPDLYESQQPCLDAQTPDSDQDPDGDGVTSLVEWQIGTSPCDPDSDVDGIGDGDEFRLAANPLDPQDQPLPDLIFVPDILADLGSSDNAISYTLTVRTGPANLGWRIVGDSTWIITSAQVGQGDGQVGVWADPAADLTEGTHRGTLLVTAEGSQPVLIEVRFRVPGISGLRRSWDLYR